MAAEDIDCDTISRDANYTKNSATPTPKLFPSVTTDRISHMCLGDLRLDAMPNDPMAKILNVVMSFDGCIR